MARVKPDRLEKAVMKILDKYGEDVKANLEEITKEMAKKGAQEVKRNAKGAVKGTGEYAAGWTSKVEVGRLSTTGVVYNKTPGLPHLLEHGHALRQGGRAPAFTHIEPVEEKLVAEYEKAVRSKL